MDNSLRLIPRKKYTVIKPFVDYDGIAHPIGEIWTYQSTNFVPYDDGLTLHVLVDSKEVVYRLQWRQETQGEVIENFNEYVKAYL